MTNRQGLARRPFSIAMADGDRCEYVGACVTEPTSARIIPLLSKSAARLRLQEFQGYVVRSDEPFSLVCSQCEKIVIKAVRGLGQNTDRCTCPHCGVWLDPSLEHKLDSSLSDYDLLRSAPPWVGGSLRFAELGDLSQQALGALEAVDDLFRQPSEQVPAILYHYTTPAGFYGIANGGGFWLTPRSEMNDRQEGSYGSSLFEQMALDHDSVKFSVGDGRTLTAQDFVFCMCEDQDLLSQWRGYGGQGAGFALGFDSRKLLENKVFFKLIYEKTLQETILAECARIIEELSKSEPVLSVNQIISHAHSMAVQTLKHPAFREENEWRMKLDGRTFADSVRFRIGPYGPMPFIPTGPGTPIPWSPLPLVQVVCGPSPDQEKTIRSTIDFLISKGLQHVEVTGSDTPLR